MPPAKQENTTPPPAEILLWGDHATPTHPLCCIQVERNREGKDMLDYLESKIAWSEYEERVHAITRMSDIDAELARTAGHWQARPAAALLPSFAKGVVALVAKLIPRCSPIGVSPDSAREGSTSPLLNYEVRSGSQ